MKGIPVSPVPIVVVLSEQVVTVRIVRARRHYREGQPLVGPAHEQEIVQEGVRLGVEPLHLGAKA